jgi:hypothetical protein
VETVRAGPGKGVLVRRDGGGVDRGGDGGAGRGGQGAKVVEVELLKGRRS